jgi:NADH dehydrogenase [ubiquinone] 1 alpha subcomplex assembly factor 5
LNGFEAEKNITITDISEIALMRQLQLFHDQKSKAKMVVTEDEWLPFRKNTFDAAISFLNSHWIENLKDYGLQVRSVLQKDSPFLGAMIGGNSLFELKQSMEKAESTESNCYFRARFSPTIRAEDVGRFLTESGFKSITGSYCLIIKKRHYIF